MQDDVTDEERAQVAALTRAVCDTIEGEPLGIAVSALLTTVWRACEWGGLDVQEVANALVLGAFRNALQDPAVSSEVGEA